MLLAGSTPVHTVSAPTYTTIETQTECPLTKTIEVFDETKNSWKIYDSTSGADQTAYPWIKHTAVLATTYFEVKTEDYSTYDNDLIDPTVF
jgi:hypothetical protein